MSVEFLNLFPSGVACTSISMFSIRPNNPFQLGCPTNLNMLCIDYIM